MNKEYITKLNEMVDELNRFTLCTTDSMSAYNKLKGYISALETIIK